MDLATHQSRESQTIDRTVLASAPPGNPTGEPDGAGVVQEEKGATGSAIFLIRLADAPLASYRGNHPDLPAASPEATGACLSLQSRANQAYLQYRKTRRGDFKSCAQRALARARWMGYAYVLGNHGLAVSMTPGETAVIARLPGAILSSSILNVNCKPITAPAGLAPRACGRVPMLPAARSAPVAQAW